MMLQSGLPTDFWWDAYEKRNYLTNRLPTKIVQEYITPFEALTKYCPDLSHLRIWGCKAYVKLSRNYTRKDFRDKSLVGHFIGYTEEGEIGHKIFIPEHKEIVIGVHVLFDEIIPSYSESYYQEIKKLRLKLWKKKAQLNHLPIYKGCVIPTTKIIWSMRMSKSANGKDTW